MSKRSQSNEKAWNNFDRLLLEASKLNLSEEVGSEIPFFIYHCNNL